MRVLAYLAAFSTLAGAFEINLIRGKKAEPGMFPQVVSIRSGGSGCSATLAGPRILLTAAHCAQNRRAVKAKIGKTYYDGVAYRHPAYPRTDVDVAVVILQNEVPEIVPVHVSEDEVQVGDEVTLTGYGCTQPGGGDGEFGTLRYGSAEVTGRSNYDLVSTNGSALCYGDSGSGVFFDSQLVAVNSKGNISTRNLTLELFKVREWLLDFASDKGVDICGITEKC